MNPWPNRICDDLPYRRLATFCFARTKAGEFSALSLSRCDDLRSGSDLSPECRGDRIPKSPPPTTGRGRLLLGPAIEISTVTSLLCGTASQHLPLSPGTAPQHSSVADEVVGSARLLPWAFRCGCRGWWTCTLASRRLWRRPWSISSGHLRR